jgi:serine/threonine-protein phosphatase 2B catalytic subunit
MLDTNKINRFTEPPKEGPFCDFLWADPCENDEEALSLTWMENSTRGCSYVFGSRAATSFLNKNEYLSIIRAHEAQLDG